MFDFFRNFFKPAESENVFQQPTSRQAPASPQSPPSAPQFQPKYPRQTSPTLMPDANGQSYSNADGNSINISLAAVLSALPLEFKTRVRQTEVGGATLSISVDRVLSQLSQGAVTLPFGELRKAAPELFTSAADFDHAEIALPLNEILSRINPATLVRRQNQKHIEVPQEISSPFGDQGHNLVLSVAPSKASSPVSASRSASPHAPTSAQTDTFQRRPAPNVPAQQAVPASALVQPLPRRSSPVQDTPANLPSIYAAPPTTARQSPAHIIPVQPVPMRNPVAPGSTEIQPSAVLAEPPPAIPISSALRNLGASIGTSTPSNSAGMQPLRPGEVISQPSQPAVEVPSLSLPLNSLSESWSDALRHEIGQLRLSEAQVALPIGEIEVAMKRGKVAFAWKTIRSWIRPTPLPTVSAHDAAMMELPLNVIAPLFLSRKKEVAKQQNKVALDEAIPNLFFGFPQSDSVSATPTAPEVVPTASAAEPSLSHPVTKPVETNYYVWDDASDSAKVDETEFKRKPSIETNFLSRYATPNEVVSRAAVLDGVVGALVALPDGLMVASKLPPELNGDTLAGFVPQIFGKVSQCTKELRMGELNNLNFTVGNIPWKIFRVNAIFFAAFGHAGQGLPTAQLATLAAQLDRKKQ